MPIPRLGVVTVVIAEQRAPAGSYQTAQEGNPCELSIITMNVAASCRKIEHGQRLLMSSRMRETLALARRCGVLRSVAGLCRWEQSDSKRKFSYDLLIML